MNIQMFRELESQKELMVKTAKKCFQAANDVIIYFKQCHVLINLIKNNAFVNLLGLESHKQWIA